MKYLKLYENHLSKKDILKIMEMCKKYGVMGYTIYDDGSIDINIDQDLVDTNEYEIDFSNRDLKKLPLKFIQVNCNFKCNDNEIKTLYGCPKTVEYDFDCSHNKLTSLEYCPENVNGYFDCSDNQITTLKYTPKFVGEDFYINDNDICDFEEFNLNIQVGEKIMFDGNPINEIMEIIENPDKATGKKQIYPNNKYTIERQLEFIRYIMEYDVIRDKKFIVEQRFDEAYNMVMHRYPHPLVKKDFKHYKLI